MKAKAKRKPMDEIEQYRRKVKRLNSQLQMYAQALDHANDEITNKTMKLARAREIMEANDPVNARELFGPPLPSLEDTPDSHIDNS